MSPIFYNVALALLVISALGVILLVLLQHGKGADMGAAFGSGASGSLFGATGSANFLSRMTGICATVFFLSTLALAFIAHQPAGRSAQPDGGSLMDNVEIPQPPPSSVPTAPGQAPAAAPVDSGAAVPEAPAAAAGVAKTSPAEEKTSEKGETGNKSDARIPADSK
ncbi:MAG: preprotein translocase subunit SecG [Lautropia sp.]|nr:preprotein translocase subunit SecG [Lautropia sp.]